MYWLTSLVQVSSLTNVGQPTGGVREMLNATAVAIGQGQWRLILKGEKSIQTRARAAARQVDGWAVGHLDRKVNRANRSPSTLFIIKIHHVKMHCNQLGYVEPQLFSVLITNLCAH